MFDTGNIVSFVIGAAACFFVTRIANHLSGKATLAADIAWLKAEFAKHFGSINH